MRLNKKNGDKIQIENKTTLRMTISHHTSM